MQVLYRKSVLFLDGNMNPLILDGFDPEEQKDLYILESALRELGLDDHTGVGQDDYPDIYDDLLLEIINAVPVE